MSNYRMPQSHTGQIVLWYDMGVADDTRACPAIVKSTSQSTLHLKVFGIDGEFDRTCVRHVSDPFSKEFDRIQEGGWDYTVPDRMRNPTKPIESK